MDAFLVLVAQGEGARNNHRSAAARRLGHFTESMAGETRYLLYRRVARNIRNLAGNAEGADGAEGLCEEGSGTVCAKHPSGR
jgi:hypothetical protein